MQTISVVIVNYNGLSVLVNCLRTLELSQQYIHEIIIVDNGSTDGSKTYLEGYLDTHATARVIWNTYNNGFAGANNQGAAVATGAYLLFLNNDTLLTKLFLPKMVRSLEKNSLCAAVQPLILFPDMTIDSVGSYLTPTGFLYHKAHRQKPTVRNAQKSAVYSLKGACMLWRRDIFERLGCFNEDYFAYFEETDLCHRAINAGYKLLFDPSAKIIHLGGFTSKNMRQDFIQYYNTKNRVQTFISELPSNIVFSLVLSNFVLTELLIGKALFLSPQLAYNMQLGLIVGFFTGLQKRWTTQKQRVSLNLVMKKPDISYYLALFSSLKNYQKLW